MKLQFGLIGHPVTHSISPFIHKRLFELSKICANYNLFDISPDKLASCIPSLNKLQGYNVTIPHKQNIIPFLSKLLGKANVYNSVNTVKNNKNSFGYNTDANGFLEALKFEKFDLSENVTILGCGGVARIFCFEAANNNCNITLAIKKQSFARAKILADDIKKFTNKTIQISYIDLLPKNKSIDLLINATPVGMSPNTSQIPISDIILKNCKTVFDAIYNPIETQLLKKAKSNGSKTANGLSMLIFQAVMAHNIWTQANFSKNEIYNLILDSKKILKKFG